MTSDLSALRDRFVIEVQEARSKCFSLGQNLLKLLQVLQRESQRFNRHRQVTYDNKQAGVHPPVSYLCATVETEQLDVSAVLSKCSGKNKSRLNNNALVLFKTRLKSRRLLENRADLKDAKTFFT